MFADELRTLLKEKSRTQIELAEYLGTTRQTVSRWCSGERQPKLNTLDDIAQFFKVPVTRLIDDDYKVEIKVREAELQKQPPTEAEVKAWAREMFNEAFEQANRRNTFEPTPEDIRVNKQFADMMKRRMSSMNITIDELCDGTNINKSNLESFLDGTYFEPNLLKIETIARKLQATPSYLFDWKVGEVSADTVGLISKARDAFMALDNSHKAEAINFMIYLASKQKPEQMFDEQSIEQEA